MDSGHWEDLAEKMMPYRLPEWSVRPTIQLMKEWMKRLGIREVIYMESMNTSLKTWIRLNPTWPLRAFVGVLLEYKYQRQNS